MPILLIAKRKGANQTRSQAFVERKMLTAIKIIKPAHHRPYLSSPALLFTCIFLFCGQAHGFESYEHRRMGNLAMRLAYEYVRNVKQECLEQAVAGTRIASEHPKRLSSGECEVISKLAGVKGDPDDQIYGQITRCVDDLLIPEKMFNLAHPIDQLFWFPKNRTEIPVGPKDCSGNTGAFLNKAGNIIAAGHANHAHFQDDLLVALNTYHAASLAIASSARTVHANGTEKGASYLFGALAMNAIADHYLQDFFAPGHVVTPRANLTDTLSNSMHDLANETGMFYELSDNDVKRLRDVAVLADDIEAVKSALCATYYRNHDSSRQEPADIDAQKKCMSTSLVRWTDDELSRSKHIRLKGDARLWRDDHDGLGQRVLILAAEFDSILDVIETYSGKTRNSFQNTTWKFDDVKHPRSLLDEVDRFLSGKSQAKHLEASFGFGRYLTHDSDAASQPDSEELREYQIPTFNTIVAGQIARESMYNGDHFGRSALTLYASTWCFACVQRKNNINIIPSLGYVYLWEDGFRAHGGELRLSSIIPNTETTLSVYARRVNYPDAERRVWRTGTGLRLEQGFTSFISLFVGIGTDHGEKMDGHLERRRMFFAGVNLSGPWIRGKKSLKDALSNERHD